MVHFYCAVLYAYAHYQHNALGTKPVQIHAERLAEQNPQLAEAIDWVWVCAV